MGGLAATAINIIQSQSMHDHETAHAKKRHEESMALAQMQHEKDLKIAKQTYLMAAFTSLEQHFQQLNADLISSSKESESDMFDQRNQSFQTVILSASVMFSSLSTVIIQGFLPTNADEFLFVSYALTSALSFAFLFLSIVLCIEVILRASSFMYNRARKQTTQLREAIQKTKLMMKRIRGGHYPGETPVFLKGKGGRKNKETESKENRRKHLNKKSNNDYNNDDNDDAYSRSNNGYMTDERSTNGTQKDRMNNYHPEKSPNKRRQIAEMDEDDLQQEWERHEAEVHSYLEEREKINDQTSVLVSADANSSRMSFEQFWRESCKFWADIAILFFYAGTANLLLAIMIYMWAEFFITYQSPVGAVIAVVFIGVSLVVGILLAIYLRQSDTYGKGSRKKRTGKGTDSGGSSQNENIESEREDKGGHIQERNQESKDLSESYQNSPGRSDRVSRSDIIGSKGPSDVDANSFWNVNSIKSLNSEDPPDHQGTSRSISRTMKTHFSIDKENRI
eukprot:CAMPEP_0119041198 /NCGR_PEP_ID=MMETSP1177-20130426/11384_1 /TAXON_ID=2985 /ORGANISM="Ochromonas sp, Strain CCMP1899" /LENGTH=507 /DNA_ID=CAMNT_0007007049 /DNA_START=70 /DNA_END=1593 /DNA_ORIENTATION=-